MAILERFDAPGRIVEPTDDARQAWSRKVKSIFGGVVGDFHQFYDPTDTDTPADAKPAPVGWPAFPATLLRGATTEQGRWRRADDRQRQDEYCEWSVDRDTDGKIARVTFSTEVPELWEHIAAQDPDRLLALYHEFVDERARLDDLFRGDLYVRANKWNCSVDGRLAHLIQGNNTLEAAVRLAAEATVRRVDAQGRPVTDQQILVRCAGLGNEFRFSDPRIAAAVNNAAGTGAEITLENPVGLYLDGLETSGMVTPHKGPDRKDPAEFWTIERGDADHAVRASFMVPPELDFKVGDIELDGRPIAFGAQLADRVTVRLTAVVKAAEREPQIEGCVA